MLRIFYFLCYVIYSFFTIPVKIENEILKLALTLPTSDPTTVSNDSIEMLLVVTDKTINHLSK